jgi:hypothetical protein
MIRTTFAITVAALVLAGVSGTSHAAPVAPLPAGAASAAKSDNVIQAWCGWRCRHRHWCWRHPRACGW